MQFTKILEIQKALKYGILKKLLALVTNEC